jgi:hypothetical protein
LTHFLLLLEMIIFTLSCLSFLGLFGTFAVLRHQGKQSTRLPWPTTVWFFCFALSGMLLSTVASYLRYFRGSTKFLSVADICSLSGLLSLAIAFLVILKSLKVFAAANGGTIWSVVEASQRQVWQSVLRRGKP